MKVRTLLIFTACLFYAHTLLSQPVTESMHYWPQWRGPSGTGSVPSGNPPIKWSETSNIRWKIPLPGVGHGTPVIWGNHIFVTAAVPPNGSKIGKIPPGPVKFVVMAMDRTDGTVRWERVVCEEVPHEKGNIDNSWASASPIVDGEHVYAFFGSRGLYCLTLDGDPVWEKDIGDMKTRAGHGEASSPALYQNRLVVN